MPLSLTHLIWRRCGGVRLVAHQRAIGSRHYCFHQFVGDASASASFSTQMQVGSMTQKKTALVAIADGSEDIESAVVIDCLRRGHVTVTVASVTDSLQVRMARQTLVTADVLLDDVKNQCFDAIVLPGGMPGAEHLRDSANLVSMLQAQNRRGDWIGAICASPAVVLSSHGLLEGKKATGYPADAFQQQLSKHAVPQHLSAEPVVVSGNCVTSRGPGTAFAFALNLLEVLSDAKKAESVANALLCPYRSAPRV